MLEWIILNFDAFELIEKGLQEELAKQGFSEAVPLEDPAGRAVMFTRGCGLQPGCTSGPTSASSCALPP